MVGGGLMQLVAYGAQDVYLTGNPQITFFKVVYRRYTNFAIETVELTLNGTADFGKRVTVTITRNGDLVTRMYLRIELGQVTMNNYPQDELSRIMICKLAFSFFCFFAPVAQLDRASVYGTEG